MRQQGSRGKRSGVETAGGSTDSPARSFEFGTVSTVCFSLDSQWSSVARCRKNGERVATSIVKELYLRENLTQIIRQSVDRIQSQLAGNCGHYFPSSSLFRDNMRTRVTAGPSEWAETVEWDNGL